MGLSVGVLDDDGNSGRLGKAADIRTPQVPLWAATSMQAPASEMPGGISGFRKNILLTIVELGYWQGPVSIKVF